VSVISDQLQNAITSGMLGIVGYVFFRMLFRRRWAAATAAVLCYTPVVLQGMFPGGTPVMDFALAATITLVFVVVVARAGLLATVAALATHFILLRAPLTTDLSGWRGPMTVAFLGSVMLPGLAACYIATARNRRRTA
jgi:hypothetical protein